MVKNGQNLVHVVIEQPPLSLISPQPMMVERQTILHMNTLLNGIKILGEQLSSYLRGCHATSSLESVFFTRKVA